MCGIAGIINYEKYDLEKLRNSLIHRGPDEQNIFCEDNIALVHTRLAIVDINSASQPMHRKHCTIVYNGEIYNHKSLRDKCKNFNFTTNSDTEVLLAMYLEYGQNMFKYLDGMFAFAIFDRKRKSIFMARDRAGKKPLYFIRENGSLFFASELNAIKSVETKLDIDEDAIAAYLRCGFFLSQSTPYKTVKELPPGTYIEIYTYDVGSSKTQYFDMRQGYNNRLNRYENSLDTAMEKLDLALRKSVKDRLLSSDLEVGAFLSGGIDSSLIVAIASEYTRRLKTFTICFDNEYDESHLAKFVAEKYGTDHNEIKISVNLRNDLEKILTCYGKPFMDASAIPIYYVSQAAKKHLTVVLNGDGADEIFGGYRRYVPVANNWIGKAEDFVFLLKYLPKPHDKKKYYNYLYRLLYAASLDDKTDRYLALTTDIFEGYQCYLRHSTYLKTLDEELKYTDMTVKTPLAKMLCLDFAIILPADLLQKMDIASMANSLEARSPFLSKYIIELAPSIPDHFKIKGRTTKFILRKLAEKYLPKKLIDQPKRGFEVPLRQWVENDISDIILDNLAPGCFSENFVNKKFLRDLIKKKISVSREKRAKMLWTLFCMEVWRKSL